MNNQRILTSTGAIILAIIAITVGVFVWVYEKTQNSREIKTDNASTISSQTIQFPETNQQEILQPIMPSLEDEAGKSPELLVKDFYTWYIGNVNYSYQKSRLHETPININELIKNSPFISSNYIQNIEKRRGMYNTVLCTNDDEFNIVKEYGKALISGNNARVDILRGYTRNEKTTEIQVFLKKEGRQWKIDDVSCDFQTK